MHDRTETVDKNKTITINGSRDTSIAKNDSLTVGADISTTAGKSITLTCGPSTIKMDPSGITISGLKIEIDGKVAVKIHSTMTQVTADAALTLQGAIVKIN